MLGLYVNLTLWRARGANQRPYALLHTGARRATNYTTEEDILLSAFPTVYHLKRPHSFCNIHLKLSPHNMCHCISKLTVKNTVLIPFIQYEICPISKVAYLLTQIPIESQFVYTPTNLEKLGKDNECIMIENKSCKICPYWINLDTIIILNTFKIRLYIIHPNSISK